METDADLERWRGWLLAGIVFGSIDPYVDLDYSAEADRDDDFYAPAPVRPKERPPLRSDGIALPEPEG